MTGGHVLLFPEGVLLLNTTAAAVLELCDGRRTPADVVARLGRRYGTEPDELIRDVTEFLGHLRERGLLHW